MLFLRRWVVELFNYYAITRVKVANVFIPTLIRCYGPLALWSAVVAYNLALFARLKDISKNH
jgi:hypothetical protein